MSYLYAFAALVAFIGLFTIEGLKVKVPFIFMAALSVCVFSPFVWGVTQGWIFLSNDPQLAITVLTFCAVLLAQTYTWAGFFQSKTK